GVGWRCATLAATSRVAVKASGAAGRFSRGKIAGGVRKASQGLPVGDDDIARLAQQVEESIRSTGAAEVDAHEVGLAILGPLQELNEIAYLRFASVYRGFTSLEDFEAAITALRHDRDRRTADEAQDEKPDGVVG